MKPYHELTLSGKLRRLSQLARQALNQYDLPIGRCYLLNRSTNLIYAVYTTTGQRYILRLATPGWRTLSDLRSEAMWLQALRQETEIPVPEVIVSAEGEAVVTVSAAGVPQPHQATLMSWLPGVHLGHRLTPENLLAMGELFAQLHLHGQAWQPPADFTTRQFTRFISRGEPEELLPKLASRGVATTELDTLQTVMADVNGVYQALDPADMRVIHCDLWHDNIKLYHGRLCPFDFEDTVWGYRLHDIAMAMLDLLEEVGRERYQFLLAAFQQGYTQHLAWPAGEMAALQCGRLLWKANYLANIDLDYLQSKWPIYLQSFRHFLEYRDVQLPHTFE